MYANSMEKILIITDSNSGIKQSECKGLPLVVVPMPIFLDGEEYLEDISIDQKEFFYRLSLNQKVNTSQPSMYYIQDMIRNYLLSYDKVIYIPMSSGLSGTCASLQAMEKDFPSRFFVIDNKRISVTQKESVYEALNMVKKGKSCQDIVSYLNETKDVAAIYIYLDTLEYLKRGGRISPTAASLASLLHIKPLLTTNGGAFEKYAMVRNLKQAKIKMIEQARLDLETRFKPYYDKGHMVLFVAHTTNEDEAKIFKKEIKEKIKGIKVKYIDPLSLSVSCHIGPNALAIALAVSKHYEK